MKIVIGITEDSFENEKTLAYLEKFGLLQASLTLVYVLERIGSVNLVVGGSDFVNNVEGEIFWKQKVDFGRAALEKARKFLSEKGARCDMELLEGPVSNELISYCQRSKTDLLALGSSEKGSIEGILIGSVGRKALIGADCSVLIVKGSVPLSKSKLKAVLATDHSAYANACFKLLNQFPRLNLSETLVLNVISKKTMKYFADTGIFNENTAPLSVHEYFVQENRRLIESLAPVDTVFRAQVEAGNLHEILNETMVDEKADLLIMAAQGHGFFERLRIGSVSLKQAMTQKKSVLVLRNPAYRA